MRATGQHEGFEAARLDTFVDGAFAFTLTRLVIGGEQVPRNAAELLEMPGGVPAFGVCFSLIAYFWRGHVRWRRRCRQADGTGPWLSLMLVFFALILVYPPHMMFASVSNAFSGGVLPSDFKLTGVGDVRTLSMVYGLVFTCMAGTLMPLFRHAARRALEQGYLPWHRHGLA